MTAKKPSYLVGLILFVMLLSPHLLAAQCTIDSNFMDRGERKVFIICGKDIPRNYTLKGLSEANIIIEYEQYLEMCGIGIDTPGIYLIAKAEDDAQTASVSILSPDTQEAVCEDLTVSVPNRIHILKASLEDPTGENLPFKILTIKAGESHDLSQACEQGLTFPEGKWPSLSLLSQQEIEDIPLLQRLLLQVQLRSLKAVDQPLTCTESSIRALVTVYGQQRYPAKIIISKVKGEGDEEKEGVAYVTLPPPQWASSMKDEDAKYIDVNGIRTRYFDKGEGDALLLIHGGQAGDTSVGAQKWQQNFDYLSNYFHVYAIDRLGQGYTDNPKTDKDYEEYYPRVVDHVYGFMKAVGIEKVHVVGQSQGGWPVTRLALDHPEMVKSLVCMDCVMAPSAAPGQTMPPMRVMNFHMYIMWHVDPPEGPTLESIRRGSELWSYSMNNITDDKARKGLKITRLPKRNEARKQMVKHNMNPANPFFRSLKGKALEEIKEGKLKVPTLVVWGYNDPSSGYEAGIELFKLVSSGNPESQVRIFNDCGHSPYIEYPELFNRLIVSFCGAY